MTKGIEIVSDTKIQNLIYTIRDVQVMLDRDLAEIYQVETRVLNQAVKRNLSRFPERFRFQMNEEEFENWKSQNVISNREKMGLRRKPYVFTEQGISMLSAVLNSETAVKVSIQIMEAFVAMRKNLLQNAGLLQRMDQFELRLVGYDQKFDTIFKALEAGQPSSEKGIFFEGQIFDAYVFVSDLIKKVTKEIILIDNYVDESVLVLLSKRAVNVKATIYTKKITHQLELDLAKHHQQYPEIQVKNLSESHDRFLILDGAQLYHFGASLKDLGKKWFAFSQMDSLCKSVLQKLNH